jgi:hypothetical protein
MKARDKAYHKQSPGYKFLSTAAQRMIRTSKRKFVNGELNDNKNSAQWWNTVKKLTTNTQKALPPDTTVINNKRMSNLEAAKNLNEYYKV